MGWKIFLATAPIVLNQVSVDSIHPYSNYLHPPLSYQYAGRLHPPLSYPRAGRLHPTLSYLCTGRLHIEVGLIHSLVVQPVPAALHVGPPSIVIIEVTVTHLTLVMSSWELGVVADLLHQVLPCVCVCVCVCVCADSDKQR